MPAICFAELVCPDHVVEFYLFAISNTFTNKLESKAVLR